MEFPQFQALACFLDVVWGGIGRWTMVLNERFPWRNPPLGDTTLRPSSSASSGSECWECSSAELAARAAEGAAKQAAADTAAKTDRRCFMSRFIRYRHGDSSVPENRPRYP